MATSALHQARRRAPPWNWPRTVTLTYHSGPGRDLRLDFLRGLAIVVMIIDHIAGPSWLSIVTGGGRFFTSAAEGFVLLAGIVAGLVYQRQAARSGLFVAARRQLRRAGQLYLVAVALGLALVSLAMVDDSTRNGQPMAEAVFSAGDVWGVVTLHETAMYADIAVLYTLLFLTAPLVLFLLHRHCTWVALLVTWSVWAVDQFFPERAHDIPWAITGNGLAYVPAWQALFFTGMVIGYHRSHLDRLVPTSVRRALLIASAVGSFALYAAFLYTLPKVGGYALPEVLWHQLLGKADLPPGRIVSSTVLFAFLYLCTDTFWVPLLRGLGWLLIPLGENALLAYVAHVLVAVGVRIVAPLLSFPMTGHGGLNAIVQVSTIILVWLTVTHGRRGWRWSREGHGPPFRHDTGGVHPDHAATCGQ